MFSFLFFFFYDNDWRVFYKVHRAHKHLAVKLWFAEGGKRRGRRVQAAGCRSSRRVLVSADEDSCLRTENKRTTLSEDDSESEQKEEPE